MDTDRLEEEKEREVKDDDEEEFKEELNSRFQHMSTGAEHSAILMKDGTVQTKGSNKNG
jgi:alpha-tubulin suppressor-like RCC1 family protein